MEYRPQEFCKRHSNIDLAFHGAAIDPELENVLLRGAHLLCTAFQTAWGVYGGSIWRTPRCHRASTIALPIAAGGPIVPVSLPPFTPSGLLGAGVQMKSVRSIGMSL